jgi:hypothetical protein
VLKLRSAKVGSFNSSNYAQKVMTVIVVISVIGDITSGAASVATHDGMYYFALQIHHELTRSLRIVPGLFTSATSAAGSIGNIITSHGGVVEYLTCKPFLEFAGHGLTREIAEGGHAFTVVTSAGGAGFTLAISGAGQVTSAFGSVYTAATAAASSQNAAVGPPSFGVTSSLLVGFATVILSTMVGAVITL